MISHGGNLCTACGLDFASVAGFDNHRVGKHEYTDSEGLLKCPRRTDGRRCLRQAEIRERGFTQDTRSRWVDPKSRRSMPCEGAYSPSKVTEGPRAMLRMSEGREGVRTAS